MIKGIIALKTTKYSRAFKDVLSSGNCIALARKGKLQPLIDIVKTIDHTRLDRDKFNTGTNEFLYALSSRKLALCEFVMYFDVADNSYHFTYTVQSQIYETDAFKVDGYFQNDNILFLFAPSMLMKWFLELVDRMPLAELDLVAQGQ
ncbi:MAG: hypothetical protein Q7T39_22350 [Polaromonas sp.]|nr:hypothetical protein [Polaromonas sp.]